MLKNALLTTHFALIVTSAAAQTTGTTENAITLDAQVAVEKKFPNDVAARINHLRTYGERFEAVIRLIEAERLKPSWTWEDCDGAADASPEERLDC